MFSPHELGLRMEMRQELVRTRAKGSQSGEELLETICVGLVQRPKERRGDET